mmetsp:Transcript_134659/g.430054  ORF Transcript_134659/g.430054 Transcript_134659/m.430054 type:complete len:221 (-) Transcript_134659:454-1116(-)
MPVNFIDQLLWHTHSLCQICPPKGLRLLATLELVGQPLHALPGCALRKDDRWSRCERSAIDLLHDNRRGTIRLLHDSGRQRPATARQHWGCRRTRNLSCRLHHGGPWSCRVDHLRSTVRAIRLGGRCDHLCPSFQAATIRRPRIRGARHGGRGAGLEPGLRGLLGAAGGAAGRPRALGLARGAGRRAQRARLAAAPPPGVALALRGALGGREFGGGSFLV